MEALFSILCLLAEMSSIIYDAKKKMCIIIFHMASCVWPCAVNGFTKSIYCTLYRICTAVTCFFLFWKIVQMSHICLLCYVALSSKSLCKHSKPFTTTSISERPPPCRTLRSSSSTRLTWAQKYQTHLFKKLFSSLAWLQLHCLISTFYFIFFKSFVFLVVYLFVLHFPSFTVRCPWVLESPIK